MSLTLISGPDDTQHEGIQNNPVEGFVLPSKDIEVTDQTIRDYVNSVGDEGFWAFSGRVRAKYGLEVAPLTLFDNEIGAEMVGISARFALHAKQEFKFRGLVTPGETYRLGGEMVSVVQKRGIDYFVTDATASPLSGLDQHPLRSIYTRAYRFPENQYVRSEPKPKAKLSDWLAKNGAKQREKFPAQGSVVEGRTTLLDQARLNIYSGPVSGVHTDNAVARRGGLQHTVAQGLMGTELETELYRDLFGLAFYRRGDIAASYVETIYCGDSLRAIGVVESVTEEKITLRTAVATTEGFLVAVGRVSVDHWQTEDVVG